MMGSQYMGMGNLGFWDAPPILAGLLIPLAILDLALRGLALWRSARAGEQWWFIALLLINSLGILPGIYLLSHKQQVQTKKK